MSGEKEPLLSPQSKHIQESLDASTDMDDKGERRRSSTLLSPLVNTVTALRAERIRYVAAFSFVACLGAMLIGMSIGYTGTTSLELEDIYKDGDKDHGIKQNSEVASLFGVST